jgi:predicted glutamine amidotransferase
MVFPKVDTWDVLSRSGHAKGVYPEIYYVCTPKTRDPGFWEEVADFYRIEEYQGYLWLGHNRYPTNTPGWWGGAHPFSLLGWSVVHNGEITSYGTNQRYIESYGYNCTMYTDTEVVAYLFDLLVRKHGLSEELAVRALAPPSGTRSTGWRGGSGSSTPPSGSPTGRPS